jgi:hypothetical protein
MDLPDDIYVGDLVVGNSHLKSGGAQADRDQRDRVGRRIAYLIDAQYNGLGTGTPDPFNHVIIPGQPTTILDPATPFVWGGDLNEDEDSNGRKGPAEWMANAALTGGTDGTDRDRSDSTYDAATDVFTGSRSTQSSSKLDYLLRQDSIATLRRQFIFNSSTVIPNGGMLPPELTSFFGGGGLATSTASDHRPVIIDLIVPLVPPEPDCPMDWDGNGTVNSTDVSEYLNDWFADQTNGTTVADYDGNGTTNSTDFSLFLNDFFTAPIECL